MIALDVAVEDPRWGDLGIAGLADRAVGATLAHLDLDPDQCEVSVMACDDRKIADLNADFRGKATPTNVLSWPAQERGAAQAGGIPLGPEPGFDGLFELGDIAIAFDTCAAEARAAGKPLADHAIHLLIHGTLHLLGYDHERDADATVMERIEVEILGKLGLDDPYRENAG